MKAVILALASLLLTYAAAREQKKIVCYFSSWAVYRVGNGYFDTDYIDTKLCTHFIYAFVGLNEDGTIKVLDPWIDTPNDGGRAGFVHFVELRDKNPDAKFLVSLGGWNEGSKKFSDVVGDPEKRKTLVESATDFLIKYRFDGLDYDWEYPNQRSGVEADRTNFIHMLKELRERFDKENFLLTAAVGASQKSASLSYIVPELVKHVHFINLMTYDFHGIWDKETNMNAPLFAGTWEKNDERLLNVNAAVKYWLDQGAPPEKIVMGLPFYGKSFTLDNEKENGIEAPASKPGNPGPYTKEPGTLGYNEICEMNSESKWKRVFQMSQQVPYMVKGDQWVSFDDPWSIKKKVEYINRLNLGGAMVWSIDMDDFRGNCGTKYAMLKMINHVLYNT